MAPQNPNLETLFSSAIEIESAADREAYLEEACGGNAALKYDVDRLLRAHFRVADEFLEAPALGSAARPSFDALAPRVSSPHPAPSIDITDRVRRGENVLAIQVLNNTISSSDLSLIPVLRGRPKNHVLDEESFAAFRRVASGDDAARRVAYLNGRLLELRGEYEAARLEFEKAAGEGERDPRPVRAIVRCLRALGRDKDVESRLRAALTSGVRGLDRLWLQTQNPDERRLEEILRSWPRGATPPIQLPRTDRGELSRAPTRRLT